MLGQMCSVSSSVPRLRASASGKHGTRSKGRPTGALVTNVRAQPQEVLASRDYPSGIKVQVTRPQGQVPSPELGRRGARGDGSMMGKKVVIVGGGPAGACAALYMAKLGARVDVYERRSDADQVAGASSRSYIIILQERGLQAMAEAGAGVTVDDTSRFLGSVNIAANGKLKSSPSSGTSAGFSRADLALHLMNAAQKQHPSQVKFHLGWQCIGGDLSGQSITFKNTESGETKSVKYDLLIGADGQNSRVRDIFEDQIEGYHVDINVTDREYKPFSGLTSDTLEPPEWRQGKTGRTLFMWNSKKAGYTLTANRRQDGVFAGNFGSTSAGFAALKSEADYLELLHHAFSGLPEGWAEEIAKQVANKDASKFPKTIKCSQLHGPSAVLIGDAAHAVTPILGQGANAALEDCKILGKAFESAGDNVEAAVRMFNKTRVADAHSLVDINRYVEKATRLGPLSVLLFAPVLIHVVVGNIVHKLFPFLCKPPAMMRLDKGVGYREVVVGIARDCLIFTGTVALIFVLRGVATSV